MFHPILRRRRLERAARGQTP